MTKLAAALACLIAVPALVIASLGGVIVDVRQDGPESSRVIVPLPLALAWIGLCFVDDDEMRVSLPELARYHDAALRVIDELAEIPDAQLIDVRSNSEEVKVTKVGNAIEVRVSGPDKNVRVRLPLGAIQELLDRYDGQGFDAHDLLAVVRALPSGEAVHVRDRSHEVRILVW
jgi:hypothetical protein